MAKPRVLLQLDGDAQASAFDAIVAVDCGVDQLLSYDRVNPDQVRGLVHGAIFTRGPQDLHRTAIFVGGTDVAHGERLLEEVIASFVGPMRVSVMLDANGANTTAAAAVLVASKHVELAESPALVLAATGSVGQRAARLLAQRAPEVRLASRSADRAEAACARVAQQASCSQLLPVEAGTPEAISRALEGVGLVISAGAAGIQLLPRQALEAARDLRVAIDLNAVPPLGIEGMEVADKAQERDGVVCYGALGVGQTKMKIHRAAVARLFESNDVVLDAEEIYQLGVELEGF